MFSKFILFLIGFMIFSCSDEVKVEGDVYYMKQNSHWTAENFKSNYTIQFPSGFTGTGMVGFEGNMFQKEKSDGTLKIMYSYCGPLYCSDFGENKFDSMSKSIYTKDEFGNTIELDKLSVYYQDDKVVQLFYYNSNLGIGKLYMKVDQYFTEAANLTFTSYQLSLTTEILKTIKER